MKLGTKEVWYGLFTKTIENSNLKDWSCTMRINGLIRLKEKKINLCGELETTTDHSKKVAQEIAKRLKTCEEFVAKKQIEPDNWDLMKCLCNKRGILRLWVNCWLKFRIYRTVWILCQTRGNFTILNQRAALERPTFPVNPWSFRVL